MTTEILQKNAKKFVCELCNFNANNKNNFDKHLLTKKHKNNEMLQNTTEIMQKNAKKFVCECGKEYSHHSSLYKHKKTCKTKAIIVSENTDYKGMFMEMVKENKEMRSLLSQQQQQISEMIPKIGNNNNNIKQKFNINVFLNEKCKDALSMDQFIDQIEVSIKNLLTTRDKGQVQGVTDIIMDNMNRLSIYERPLHCTDKKRETLYIKTNEWQCDENKTKINDAIKKIESKQFKNIKNWVDQHPNYMTNEKEQDEFLKIVKETSNSIEENREKVIKNLCNQMANPLNNANNI